MDHDSHQCESLLSDGTEQLGKFKSRLWHTLETVNGAAWFTLATGLLFRPRSTFYLFFPPPTSAPYFYSLFSHLSWCLNPLFIGHYPSVFSAGWKCICLCMSVVFSVLLTVCVQLMQCCSYKNPEQMQLVCMEPQLSQWTVELWLQVYCSVYC